jgi:hypothetical protein
VGGSPGTIPASGLALGGAPGERVVAAVFSVCPETALHYTIGTVDQEADAFQAHQ